MIILFDLAGRNDCRFSPNCWRTRLALAHKDLRCEAHATHFTDIAGIADGKQKALPVIDDGGRIVGDSAVIADYLETMYPERPSLFGGVSGRALTDFVGAWAVGTLHAGIIRMILYDIYCALDPADQDYFRASREARFGKPLEAVQEGREEHLPVFRKSLAPLRHLLSGRPFIGGEGPLYADYLVFGPFQWAATVSPFTLVEPDDPVAAWLERCRDLYGGLARQALAAAPV